MGCRSDYQQYLNYYKQLDRYRGSAIYNFFNVQVDLARAMKNFSRLGNFMNLAEDWQPGDVVNLLLDIYDLPEQVLGEIEQWVDGDVIPFLTGGYIKCELFLNDSTGFGNAARDLVISRRLQ